METKLLEGRVTHLYQLITFDKINVRADDSMNEESNLYSSTVTREKLLNRFQQKISHKENKKLLLFSIEIPHVCASINILAFAPADEVISTDTRPPDVKEIADL